MADDAAAATTATEEEAANRPEAVVEATTTDDNSVCNPHLPAPMDGSTSGGDVVALKGKRQRDRDDIKAMPDDKCEEKKVKFDEPAPSGLLARRAGFVPHLKIRIPEYYDSDYEST
ncbi:hypothetical protein BAE44_0020782 [Dichanthelium oligosanthes]|uniref:Uncharacterized protein n=1 Tax=Dichanthelium oligosanthes TaxID=888268 RepID=A0A1E5UZC6_9POAL|nr:hypothetical protein BAE44_0020782 [Dichanthelium oligosanthes]